MNKQPKKLRLNKETLRDLMAQDAGHVKGGEKTGRCATFRAKCSMGIRATACGYGCPTYYNCTAYCTGFCTVYIRTCTVAPC